EDNKDENNQENVEEAQNQEDDKEEKQETKTEETQTKDDKNTDPSNQIEIKDDHKGDDEVVATVDVTPSDLKEFNTEMTKELQKAVSEKSASLVYGYNITYDLFPADKLQAVAKFKDDVSSGYVVRYGVNKIGLAVRYDETPEDIGYNIHDGAAILNQTEDVIKNDYPSEYKELVQNLVNGLNQGEAKIEFAY
ncbi:hypothetical protein, partial [Rhodovulum adriaticum]|uniref:hypothetical protein n=1 Tax=Rhodovulum adriaticum TaxID=35804 RepID=UPI0019038C73